jgi:hypothetical protein
MQVSMASKRHSLPELPVRVPLLHGLVLRRKSLDRRVGLAPAGLASEQLIEVQRLDGIVRLDAMPGRDLREARGRLGFLRAIAAMAISGRDEVIVQLNRNNELGGHVIPFLSPRGNVWEEGAGDKRHVASGQAHLSWCDARTIG